MAEWNDRANQVVQMCLQTDPTTLPNVTVGDELAAISRKTAALVPQIGSSAVADALSGDDAEFWGEAIGYLFSAAIRRWIPKKVPVGEPLEIDTGTNKFKFAVPPGTIHQLPMEEVWTDIAWESIGLVSSVLAALVAIRATPLFVATGPVRAREEQGRFRTFNPLYNMMEDLIRTEAIFLQNEAAWEFWNII